MHPLVLYTVSTVERGVDELSTVYTHFHFVDNCGKHRKSVGFI
jgi:hypothetical protein